MSEKKYSAVQIREELEKRWAKSCEDGNDRLLRELIAECRNDSRSSVRDLAKRYEIRIGKLAEELERLEKMRLYEREYESFGLVCGIDEAGRGPLAGPVAAAAVILPKDARILYLNDSKQLSAKMRDSLFDEIMEKAVSVGVGIVGPERIDEINILQADYEAMRIAAGQLSPQPAVLLNDAVTIPDIGIRQVPIIKGDAKSLSIAAASVIAKVTRDRLMLEYDQLYPEYGFAQHKGYGSAQHMEAIRKYGPCPIHRKTFLTKLLGGESSHGPESQSSRSCGTYYEEVVSEVLKKHGYRILERNFRCRQGEIDLVAEEGRYLVFIEVKYRSDLVSGSPLEAVDARKQQRICRTADYYRMIHHLGEEVPVRFDAAAVGNGRIRVIRDAFPYIPKDGK